MQGPLMRVQRNLVEAEVLHDLGVRLQFYDEARDRELPHVGSVLFAEDDAGDVCGFIDVGMTVYDPGRARFALPNR